MKKKLLIILPIIGIISYFVYQQFFTTKTSAPKYTTATATKGTLVVSLTASGSVATSNSRTVTTTASGVVKKIYVKEGQKVSTGTPIMEIDLDLDGRQKLQSAYSSYLSAQNSLKTTQDKLYSLQSDLVNTTNIFNNQFSMMSPDDPNYIQKHNSVLTAQTTYDNLSKQIIQQNTALEASRLAYQSAGAVVYSPISGTIGSISLSPGMILNPTSSASNSSNIENKIAIVKTNATPSITVSLTEIDVPKVKVGNKVTVTLSAFFTKTYTGKIVAIDTTGTVSSGVVSYPVTITLDSGAPDIFANMSATANILTDFKDNILIVPNGAIISQNGENFVRVLKENILTNLPVVTGLISDTETEIVSGIDEGQSVVTAVTTSSTTKTTTSATSVFGGLGGAGRTMGR
ncbi:MAG: efflux RND transporter periplasmic adaptor subunit [Candidatus Shapirobacteria bacterium]